MDRRTFLKATIGASAATAWLRPDVADAALPKAKITRIRFFEAPTVMPLQIPLLQSNMVVMIETDSRTEPSDVFPSGRLTDDVVTRRSAR